MSMTAFGKVTPVAAGTPIQATTKTGVQALFQRVRIQALPGNTGLMYVILGGAATPGDRRTDLVGVVAILPAPASATTGPFTASDLGNYDIPAGVNLANIWIDTSHTGDGVLITGFGA